ncbi:putative lens fiber major intrinsic protein-like isoform X2 [Apostichopus japonicus]|uniref:Putative lens fiber major intrinsic protein-like isoform X2 n=1 Tax=Stichopus japonicus TaxID=307972 RepID=A0A2G8K4U1_STIJA|nr:putative lens fiber major intrinsic protein-like isoform X2 [Apostichopus japonicus]
MKPTIKSVSSNSNQSRLVCPSLLVPLKMGSYLQQMGEEFRSLLFWRAVLAEFVGMTLFLFMGLGATSAFPSADGGNLRIAFAFGIAIATFVHVTAHISGGHLNPAVTLAFFSLHKITLLRALMYVLAQMFGAVVGTGLIRAVTPTSINGELGPTVISSEISVGQGVLVEAVLTFQLVLTIFATVDPKRPSPGGSGPLAIGLSVFLGHVTGVPLVQ